MNRLSIVDNVKMAGVTSSSILQIGDSRVINLDSRVLAVQKEIPAYQGDEGDLSVFSFYREEIPRPDLDKESVQLNQHDEVPVIKVGNLRVMSAASSSLVHIGSTEIITTVSHVKHFRHFLHVPRGFKERPELTIHTGT